MEQIKGFSDRVQRWLNRIPGIRTYEDREHRRETDKRLREHLAARLQGTRSQLSRVVLGFTQKGELGPVADLDRLSAHIQQIADTIRYASYGYSGVFDLPKIREQELDQLYNFDLALMGNVEQIQAIAEGLENAAADALPNQIRAAEQFLDGVEAKFRDRADFLKLNKPGGNGKSETSRKSK